MSRPVHVLVHDDDVSVYVTHALAVAAVVDLAGEDIDPEELAGLDDEELTRWSFESLGGRVSLTTTSVIGELRPRRVAVYLAYLTGTCGGKPQADAQDSSEKETGR